jgi:hypothetical protein
MTAANDLLLDAFGRVGESVPAVLEGLSADQSAWRPAPRANSIAWLVWHLTRVLDGHLAELTSDDQVWLANGFADAFGLDLDRRDTGYGHRPEQVAKVVVDPVSLLADYHAATQDAVRPFLENVGDFDRIVDTRWDPPVTLGVRLVSVVDDLARHIGQAEYVRGLLVSSSDPR